MKDRSNQSLAVVLILVCGLVPLLLAGESARRSNKSLRIESASKTTDPTTHGDSDGRFQYTALNGAIRTVRASATTEEPEPEKLNPEIRNPQIVKPPFGLSWEESAQRLERLLLDAKAGITKKEQRQGDEIWHVDGLVQAGLKQTYFILRNDGLISVVLEYEKDDWSEEKHLAFFDQLRGRVNQRYGEGTEFSPEKLGDKLDAGVEWKKDKGKLTLLRLRFTERAPRKIQVIYDQD